MTPPLTFSEMPATQVSPFASPRHAPCHLSTCPSQLASLKSRLASCCSGFITPTPSWPRLATGPASRCATHAEWPGRGIFCKVIVMCDHVSEPVLWELGITRFSTYSLVWRFWVREMYCFIKIDMLFTKLVFLISILLTSILSVSVPLLQPKGAVASGARWGFWLPALVT